MVEPEQKTKEELEEKDIEGSIQVAGDNTEINFWIDKETHRISWLDSFKITCIDRQILLPLSIPTLATIELYAMIYWNLSWKPVWDSYFNSNF